MWKSFQENVFFKDIEKDGEFYVNQNWVFFDLNWTCRNSVKIKFKK